ncbi:hypothetical protein AAMO2058_000134700 [Amorphochlora amoebiformis]
MVARLATHHSNSPAFRPGPLRHVSRRTTCLAALSLSLAGLVALAGHQATPPLRNGQPAKSKVLASRVPPGALAWSKRGFIRDLRVETRCAGRGMARVKATLVADGVKDDVVDASLDAKSDPLPSRGDVLVIGSGLGGLCCGALLAASGKKVVVLESHSEFGGAAHSWKRRAKDGGIYKFESGPSLFSGLSPESTKKAREQGQPANNPLRSVLDAVHEDCDWITYKTWGCIFPDQTVDISVGGEAFSGPGGALDQFGGPNAKKEWNDLLEYMKPLISAAQDLPVVTAALREDRLVALTMLKYLPSILKIMRYGPKLNMLQRPFSEAVKAVNIQDPFILNWLNLLSFLLQGTPSDSLLCSVMAYMLGDWYKEDAMLDFPKGGSGAIIDALVRSIRKNGGSVVSGAHVEEVVLDSEGRASHLRVRHKQKDMMVQADNAVVSNADLWSTRNLIKENQGSAPSIDKWKEFANECSEMDQCESFMHLHLGIRAEGIPKIPPQFAVVRDWQKPIESEGNVMIIAIPSLIDPSMAPEGKHVIHAYTAGNEPIALWKDVERGSPEYSKLKEERSQVLWEALERIIPDIRSRVEVEMVGTPLTHSRFLRRSNGTYGPLLKAGDGMLPGHTTPIPNLYTCGDSTFPGIGVPAVAASGTICANTISGLREHLRTLEAMGF